MLWLHFKRMYMYDLICMICMMSVAELLYNIFLTVRRQCIITILIITDNSRQGGENGLFISLIPKVLYLHFLILKLNNLGDFYCILVGWFIFLSVQTFQPLIVINRRGNFEYHDWRCTSNYWPLSYPFR